MNTVSLAILIALALAASAAAENTPPTAPSTQPAIEEHSSALAAQLVTTQPATTQPAAQNSPMAHITVDRAKKQVVVDAEVCLTDGPLELLVCKSQTKEYESILRTDATPSSIHAALLALGLTEGKPARVVPEPDDSTKLRPMPPDGARLKITLRWKDDRNQVQEASAGQWLEIPGENKVAAPQAWVFVGSDLTPQGKYWADASGDIISVANFPASVIDVPFQSSNQNAMLYYKAKPSAIPPKGTPVEVIITPVAGAETADAARVILEIDRFGRFSSDGREVLPENLSAWAEQIKARHAKVEVQLRVDGRALAYDIRRAQQELRIGGVFDITQQLLTPPKELLPRTADQAQQGLKYWERRFAHTEEFLREPSQEAKELLEQIQDQIGQLTAMQKVWTDYGRQLDDARKKFQATTQKSPRPAPPWANDGE